MWVLCVLPKSNNRLFWLRASICSSHKECRMSEREGEDTCISSTGRKTKRERERNYKRGDDHREGKRRWWSSVSSVDNDGKEEGRNTIWCASPYFFLLFLLLVFVLSCVCSAQDIISSSCKKFFISFMPSFHSLSLFSLHEKWVHEWEIFFLWENRDDLSRSLNQEMKRVGGQFVHHDDFLLYSFS